jgi:hypothetical protein
MLIGHSYILFCDIKYLPIICLLLDLPVLFKYSAVKKIVRHMNMNISPGLWLAFLFCFGFETGSHYVARLAWNSLYSPGWPQIHNPSASAS